MNAEKEQLSVAHAVLRKKKIRGRACMHATVLLSLAMVLLIAEVVRMRPRT